MNSIRLNDIIQARKGVGVMMRARLQAEVDPNNNNNVDIDESFLMHIPFAYNFVEE